MFVNNKYNEFSKKASKSRSKMADIARFAVLSPEDLQRLYENSKNSNTDRSTRTWVNVYQTWARVSGKLQDFENYPPHELNDVLAQFFAEIRKND